MTARAEDFALVMTLEMGKPLAESRAEVAYGAEFLRWFSEEAPRISGRYATAPDGRNRLLVAKRPVGPSLLITPWNFPLAMATRKIAPALAAGCTSVLKPAALTPLTALLFAEILREAGVPDGVVNVIPTTRAGAVTGPLITDHRLRKLSFTGSTEVGRRLIADAAHQVLRVSMELGGNAPFLVFEDADLDAAVEGALLAKLRNGGEACVAANRFHVHESIAEEFTARLIERMAGYVNARGTEPASTLGPLVDESTREKVAELVAGAVEDGARVALGGVVPSGRGYFYPATVLVDVPQDARILREEIFGPVAPITTFRDEDEAVRLANASEYGLVCFAYTRDLNRALRLAERLETGMLGLKHRSRLQSGRTVRWREAVRDRSGGRIRGDRRVPRDDLHRHLRPFRLIRPHVLKEPALHITDFSLDHFSLRGRRAIVTGGNTGLGRHSRLPWPRRERTSPCRHSSTTAVRPPTSCMRKAAGTSSR